MIEINLIPDVKQELLRAQRARNTVVTFSIFAGVASLAIVALLLIYVFGAQTVRSVLADDAITNRSAELAEVEDLSETLTIQNQLIQIDSLNQTKKLESRIFEVLEAILPPAPNQVQISNLSLDADTTSLVVEGQTPNFETLEIFKKTIAGAVVTYSQDDEEVSEAVAQDISISDVSYGDDTSGARVLRFTLSFTYPEVLFSAEVPTILIQLTNEGNVTDSFLGIPRSIFVEGGEQ
jgi:hypothetical protein